MIDNYTISDSFIMQNEIKKVDLSNYDSVIIPYGTEDKVSTETGKVVYDTIEWTETIKANIKIGEACINGTNGRNNFYTSTYIQEESQSSMYPVDAVSHLMASLSIGEVKTNIGKNENSVTIDYNGKKIEFIPGSDKVIVDNYAKAIDNGATCEFKNGKLYIPLRGFCNVIDCKVDWIADGKIVNLEKTFARKSMVKRIETIEPSTETTTKETSTKSPISIPISRDNCRCPSWCSCKKLKINNYNSTTINSQNCSCSSWCSCKTNKGGVINSVNSYINIRDDHCNYSLLNYR